MLKRETVHLNDTERRVLESIDTDAMLEYLRELVSIPSHGGREPAAQRSVASKLGELRLDIDVWDLDFESLRGHPGFSMPIQREEGLGVVGTLQSEEGGCSLIFNGHIGTVAPGEEENWYFPPLMGTVADGRIYGRGIADMKGGSAALFTRRRRSSMPASG